MGDASDGPHLRPVPSGADAAVAAEGEPSTGLTPPRPMGGASRFVSDVVVELGMLPRERVDAAVEEARASGRTPDQVLIQGGALTEDQLARAIAQRFGLLHADLNLFKPDPGAINLIPVQPARRLEAGPVARGQDGALLLAPADPSHVLPLDGLEV